jgi:hypothetical protein
MTATEELLNDGPASTRAASVSSSSGLAAQDETGIGDALREYEPASTLGSASAHGELGRDESGGLELDGLQADEIRQIFLTTLPEYLEPVRQMVQALFSSASGDPDIRKALTTTLKSIADAAGRVAVEDVRLAAERLREEIILLEAGDGSANEHGPVLEALERLTQIARPSTSQATPRSPSAGSGRTLVAAFRNLEGVDGAALEKLTAAGLVTVAQVRMAEPQEIVAVTGLDRTTVDRIVRGIRAQRSESANPARADVGPAADDALERELRSQVEVELSIEELRGEVMRLRLRVESLRGELRSVAARRDQLRGALGEARDHVGRRLGLLGSAKAHNEQLARQLASARGTLERARQRATDLERARGIAEEEYFELTRNIAECAQRVSRLSAAAYQPDQER